MNDQNPSGDTPSVMVPNWTLAELRTLTLIDALRFDALVQLLEAKGVFTHSELLAQIENSVRNRLQMVLDGLQLPS